jgi:hypothetical protein
MLTLIVAGCSVVDKTAVRILGAEEGIKPVECNQIRVAVALPLNALFMFLFEFSVFDGVAEAALGANGVVKQTIYEATANMSFVVFTCLFFSTVFGFGMGTFNFYLQQAVNAATVQIANILYKLTTTLLSRITHPAPVAFSSWVGFGLSLLGIALYTFGPKILLAVFPPNGSEADSDARDLMKSAGAEGSNTGQMSDATPIGSSKGGGEEMKTLVGDGTAVSDPDEENPLSSKG